MALKDFQARKTVAGPSTFSLVDLSNSQILNPDLSSLSSSQRTNFWEELTCISWGMKRWIQKWGVRQCWN